MSVMQFNDGTADGQAHTHSVLLGGEKGFEDAIRILQADAAILHFDADGAGILHPGAQGQVRWRSATEAIASMPLMHKLTRTC